MFNKINIYNKTQSIAIIEYQNKCISGKMFIDLFYSANFSIREITFRINKDGRFGIWTKEGVSKTIKEKNGFVEYEKIKPLTQYPDLQKRIFWYRKQNLSFKDIAYRFNVAGERFDGKYFRAGIVKKIADGVY